MSPSPLSHRRTRLALTAVGLAATLALASCSGPGGVELGDDWSGAKSFALARVDGELTVVGVNPAKEKAESLAVVPAQSDDQDNIAPQLVRLADGRWLLSVPREGDKPDRRYEIDRKDRTLDAVGEGEALHALHPARTKLAALPAKGDGPLVVTDTKSGKTTRTIPLDGRATLAASATDSDTMCVLTTGKGAKGLTRLDLANGTTSQAKLPGTGTAEPAALACPKGQPVAVFDKERGSDAARPKASLTTSDSSDASEGRKDTTAAVRVDVSGGRTDAVAADADTVTVAVGTQKGTHLIELDRATGKENRRATIAALPTSEALQPLANGWLVYSDQQVAVVDWTASKPTPTPTPVDLPGRLETA